MNRKDIKLQAKGLIKTGRPKPVYVAIVYLIIISLIAVLSFKLVGSYAETVSKEFFNFSYDSNGFSYSINEDALDDLIDAIDAARPTPGASLISTLLSIMEVIIGAGFTIFALRTIDNSGASFWNLFDGFAMFFRIIWLYILEGIFTFLWALLFVIPGIIAAYRYRQAIYLLLEHPEMSAIECIRESKRLMRGHKWELFVFDLSFIGWAILIGFLDGIGESFGIEILSVIGLGVILNFWVFPYRELSYAIYYRRLVAADAAPAGDQWTPEF